MKEIIDSLLATYDIVPEKFRDKLVLIGSVNQALQGVEVVPKKDIDLATDYLTVIELIKLFSVALKSYCENQNGDNNLPFAYLYTDVKGTEVEFFDAISFGNSSYKGYLIPENLVTVTVGDKKLTGLNLESELQVCQKVGKLEKAEAIKKFLESKNQTNNTPV